MPKRSVPAPSQLKPFQHCPSWVVAVLISLLITGVYLAASIHTGFVPPDDPIYIGFEKPLTGGADMLRLLSEKHPGTFHYYRGLPRLTYALQKTWGADRPFAFRAFNAVIAGLLGAMSYALLRHPKFNMSWELAAVASCLALLHPVASIGVIDITGRETLMCSLFMVASLWAWLHAGVSWSVLSILMLIFALLSREQAVLLPALFVTADVLRLREKPLSGKIYTGRYAAVLLVVVAYLIFRRTIVGNHPLDWVVMREPAAVALSLLYSMQMLLIPFVQMVYQPAVEAWWSWWRLLVVAGAVATLVYLVWRARDGRAAAFWLVWFIVIQLPTANIIHHDPQFSERFVFSVILPCVALVATILSNSGALKSFRVNVSLAGILIVLCITVIFVRAASYRDANTFLQQWVRSDPGSALAHTYLAEHYLKNSQYLLAAQEYQQAHELAPARSKELVDRGHILFQQSAAYLMLNDNQKALTAAQGALQFDNDSPFFHERLMIIYIHLGLAGHAIHHGETAASLPPEMPSVHYRLGILYEDLDMPVQAADHFEQAVSLAPQWHDARMRCIDVLTRLGQTERAEMYRTMVPVPPQDDR